MTDEEREAVLERIWIAEIVLQDARMILASTAPTRPQVLVAPVPVVTGPALSLGAQIRAARLAAGLTMREAASIAGVAQPYLWRLENKERAPNAKGIGTRRRILAALQAPRYPMAKTEARVTAAPFPRSRAPVEAVVMQPAGRLVTTPAADNDLCVCGSPRKRHDRGTWGCLDCARCTFFRPLKEVNA